jgi:DNA repair exonuclease SbcCD ATPase subunit
MKINVQILNYKKVKDFSGLFSSGNLYMISGKNSLGKTSIIKAISSFFRAENKNVNPIANGEEKSVITCEFQSRNGDKYEGTYQMEKKGDKVIDSIILVDKEGKATSSKEKVREIFKLNDFSVDEFYAWGLTADGRRKQADILKKLLPVEIQNELEVIESQVNTKNGILFKKRALLNTETSNLKILVDKNSIKIPEKEMLKELNDSGKRIKELDELLAKYGNLEESKNRFENMKVRKDGISEQKKNIEKSYDDNEVRLNQEIEELLEQINYKKNKISTNADEKKKAIESYEENTINPFKEEWVKLKALLANTEDYDKLMLEKKTKLTLMNSTEAITLINKYKTFKINESEFTIKQIELNDANAELEQLRDQKKKLFEDADIDIPELTIIDGECMYVEDELLLPFTEEHVSYATGAIPIIKMIMRLNTETPIVLLGKAAEYDEDTLAKISQLAKVNDFIIFADQVIEQQEEIKIRIWEDLTNMK